MQLTFSKPHVSITSLIADPLPKFAVVTGLNGAGKTHLLKAILAGHVAVEGVTPAEIVYFNYGDFSVDPNYNAKQATDKQKHAQSTKKQQQFHKLHQQRAQQVQQSANLHLDPYEHLLSGLLYNVKLCKEVMNPDCWGEKPSENVSQIVGHMQAVDAAVDVSIGFVQDKWTSLSQKIHHEFETRFPGYFEFVSGEDGSAAGVLRSDFARADFFAFDLAVEVRNYIYQQYVNDHNEVRATRRGASVAFMTPEEFLQHHGAPPLDLLNEVLDEFDCNGYRFVQPTFYPSPGQNINDAMIPLQLVHKTLGYRTTIKNLSSGEQTLLALALAVYKARRSRLCRVLLLDEVDTSLHPSMTNQMLRALNGVFVDQKSMTVIMATHSASTVALAPDDSVFLLKRGDQITLRQSTKPDAIEFLTEGFATLDGSLKLVSSLSADKTYIFTEGDNVAYLEKANTFFGNDQIEMIKGIESVSGDSQLRTLFEFFIRIEHPSNVFFVWDCDVKYRLEAQNNTFPYVIAKNESNTKVLCGIENLLPEDAFEQQFYDVKPKKDGGTHSSLNKRRFTDHMVENGTIEQFENFKPIFDHIETALPRSPDPAEVA